MIGNKEETMKTKLVFLLGFAVFVLTSMAFADSMPKPRLTSPVGGESFRPGDKVKIRWQVQHPEAVRFCEQEIYLVTPKERFLISPELGPQERSYKWVVPNIPGPAYLELHLGCDVVNVFEAKSKENAHSFQILEDN